MVALDPHGLRPLSLGCIGDAYVVASETCAFDVVGAEYIRDIMPGELVIINDKGLTSERFTVSSNRAICTMEYVYFSRPDSNIQGINVHTARKNMGKIWRSKHLSKRMLSRVFLIQVFQRRLAMRKLRHSV